MTRNVQRLTEHLEIWSSVVKSKSAAGRGKRGKIELYGLKKLRELILELAVRGLLVPQDPNDEPASILLKNIAAEKARLIKAGKIKKQKKLPPITEDEKPFELPGGWIWTKLGEIGETNIGLTYSPKEIADCGLPVLRSSNIQKRKIDLHNLVRVKKDNVKNSVMVGENDLLICARNGSKALVGKTAMIKELKEPMAFGAFMAIYRSYCNHFVEVYLNSPIFRRNLEGVSTTTINQITQSNLKSTLISLPPLKEQHRIVAKVDELMTLCDRLEERQEKSISAHHTLVRALLTALTAAGEQGRFDDAWARIAAHFDMLFSTEDSVGQLKQTILQLAVMGKLVPQDPNDEPASVLLEKIAAEKARLIKAGKIKKQKKLPPISEEETPFALPEGWEWCHLSDIAGFENGDRSSKYPKNNDLVDKGIPFFGAPDIKDGELAFSSDLRFITEDKFSELRSGKLIDRDFVILLRGSVGKTAQFHQNKDHTTGFINAQMLIVRLCDTSFDKYLRNYFHSDFFKKAIAERKSGAVIQQIPANKISEIKVPIPPKTEQHRIVAKVDELMAVCDSLQARLRASQNTQQHLADALAEQSLG